MENQITELVSKAASADTSEDAKRFAEAALNVAHSYATIEGMRHSYQELAAMQAPIEE